MSERHSGKNLGLKLSLLNSHPCVPPFCFSPSAVCHFRPRRRLRSETVSSEVTGRQDTRGTGSNLEGIVLFTKMTDSGCPKWGGTKCSISFPLLEVHYPENSFDVRRRWSPLSKTFIPQAKFSLPHSFFPFLLFFSCRVSPTAGRFYSTGLWIIRLEPLNNFKSGKCLLKLNFWWSSSW